MKYIKNSNYRLLNTKDTYFLVDITEKNYGKSEKILQLNESAKKIWEYLDIYNNEEEIAKGLFNENDNLFSLEEIQDNVKSIIEILGQKGAICDYEPIGLDVEIKANSFGAFKAKMAQFRQPLIGVVEITPYCNFSCPHCYVKGFKNVEVLGIDQYKEIAKILRKKGIINVTITGGEPISHPQFKEIYMAFKNEGFLIDIFTNASLIDKDMAVFLSKYPPRSIDITLYGTSNEEYLKFTGVNDAFSKVINAMEYLTKYQIFFTTKMILNVNNYDHLDEYNQLALKYNAPFRYNVVIGKGNNTLKSGDEIALTSDKIIEIESQDPLRCKIFKCLATECNNLPYDCLDGNGWSQYPCLAGIDKVFIGYNGNMSPCVTLRNKGLNIFEHGYDNIWNYWGEKRKEKLPKEFKCMECKYFPICTPCTEEFEQINGDKTMPIESRCELAKLRWEKYIGESVNKTMKKSRLKNK